MEFAELKGQFSQGGVGECRFGHALTIIKISVHFQCGDVAAQSGQLLLLKGAHPPGRVEDDHVYTILAMEGLSDGASRVPAGGGDDNGPFVRPARSLFMDEARKDAPKSLKAQLGPWNSSMT
jgi:hypothetical protein